MDDLEGQDKNTNRKNHCPPTCVIPLTEKHSTEVTDASCFQLQDLSSQLDFFVLQVHPVHWYRVGRVKGAVPLK